MTGQRTLFVLAQPGQLSYCLPLWAELAKRNALGSIKVLAYPNARHRVPAELQTKLQWFDSWGKTDELNNIFLDFKPQRIVSSATADPFENAISAHAHDNGVDLIQFLDVAYRLLIRAQGSNPLGQIPSRMLVIDELSKGILVQGGICADNIRVVGQPAWEENLTKPKTMARRTSVAFGSQNISEITQLANLGYTEQDVWRILLECQNIYPDILMELLYKPHPLQKNIPDMTQGRSRLVKEDEDIIMTAGSMVSMYSSIMVDAYLRGVHVISLQPNLKSADHCYFSQRGLIPAMRTDDIHALARALEHCDNNQEKARARLIEDIQGSTLRVLQAIT